MAIKQTNVSNYRKPIIYFMSYVPCIAVSGRQAEQAEQYGTLIIHKLN